LSTAPVHWTLLFAGACALLQCALTALVIVQRMRSNIHFLDDGNTAMSSTLQAGARQAEQSQNLLA
jgi:uncharacterized membrane protein YecN with MAPEG domain